MKQISRKLTLALALILALAMGAIAFAEAADDNQDVELPAESEQAADEAAEDTSALEDAFEAYYEARESGRMDDLQSELDEYVAAGKLTQEQADLILNYYKEQQSLRDGKCPNCGYEFQSGFGYGRDGCMGKGGGRGRGGFGGDMGGGFGGGRGMRGMPQSYAAEDSAGDANADFSMGLLENPYYQENVL